MKVSQLGTGFGVVVCIGVESWHDFPGVALVFRVQSSHNVVHQGIFT